MSRLRDTHVLSCALSRTGRPPGTQAVILIIPRSQQIVQ